MAQLELKLSCGFIKAPWWSLLTSIGAALLQLRVSEATVFKMTLPLSGVLWIRVGDGRRHFSLVRPS